MIDKNDILDFLMPLLKEEGIDFKEGFIGIEYEPYQYDRGKYEYDKYTLKFNLNNYNFTIDKLRELSDSIPIATERIRNKYSDNNWLFADLDFDSELKWEYGFNHFKEKRLPSNVYLEYDFQLMTYINGYDAENKVIDKIKKVIRNKKIESIVD